MMQAVNVKETPQEVRIDLKLKVLSPATKKTHHINQILLTIEAQILWQSSYSVRLGVLFIGNVGINSLDLS